MRTITINNIGGSGLIWHKKARQENIRLITSSLNHFGEFQVIPGDLYADLKVAQLKAQV